MVDLCLHGIKKSKVQIPQQYSEKYTFLPVLMSLKGAKQTAVYVLDAKLNWHAVGSSFSLGGDIAMLLIPPLERKKCQIIQKSLHCTFISIREHKGLLRCCSLGKVLPWLDLESSSCACLPGWLFPACVRVWAELSGSKAIWKHGRSFLHLFAPSAFHCLYCRREEGEREEGGGGVHRTSKEL